MARCLIVTATACILLATNGIGQEKSTAGSKKLPPPSKPSAKEQLAVRAWLRENTDSGKWEEIAWSGPVFQKLPDPAVRLKYRTKSPSGEKVVIDQIFTIHKGTAEPIAEEDYDVVIAAMFEPDGQLARRSRSIAQLALDIKNGKLTKKPQPAKKPKK